MRQEQGYSDKRVRAAVFLVVLLALVGPVVGAYLPHGHGALEDIDRCPLHLFAKQAQSVPDTVAPLVVVLVVASVLIPGFFSRIERDYLAGGLTRAPPGIL